MSNHATMDRMTTAALETRHRSLARYLSGPIGSDECRRAEIEAERDAMAAELADFARHKEPK